LTLFEQPLLPRDPAKLAQLIKTCFPGGISDTALLHEKLPSVRLCKFGLSGFFDNIVKERGWISPALAPETAARYGKLLVEGMAASEHRHEAGLDALKTALLYAQLGYRDEHVFDAHVDLLSLWKSTECFDINGAVTGNTPGTELFPAQGLKVAVLHTEDAKRMTHDRITQLRKCSRDCNVFYRCMDDDKTQLLVPELSDSLLESIAREFPGVEWKTFAQWEREERRKSGRCDRRYIGDVKKLGAKHAFGFVSCASASQLSRFGGDVFLPNDEVGTLQVGDKVSFTALVNENGQVEARDIKVVGARFTGVVKHIDVGYGFIACPEAFRLFGRDVFLARQQLNEVQVGDLVSFSIDITDKGQPKARGLSTVVGVESLQRPGAPEQAGEWAALETTRTVGQVKRFSGTTSYGFISCDAVPEDVYVSGGLLLKVGECVEFDLVFNENGKPQAKNVSRPAATAPDASMLPIATAGVDLRPPGVFSDAPGYAPKKKKKSSALDWLGGTEETDEDGSTAGVASAYCSSGDSDGVEME